MPSIQKDLNRMTMEVRPKPQDHAAFARRPGVPEMIVIFALEEKETRWRWNSDAKMFCRPISSACSNTVLKFSESINIIPIMLLTTYEIRYKL